MSGFDINEHTILLVLHGSHAYGTSIATSDKDYRGVAVPPRDRFFGFAHVFEQFERKDPDTVIYDIRKFCRLAADCNPNVIEILFADATFVRRRSAFSLGASFSSRRRRGTRSPATHTRSSSAFAGIGPGCSIRPGGRLHERISDFARIARKSATPSVGRWRASRATATSSVPK